MLCTVQMVDVMLFVDIGRIHKVFLKKFTVQKHITDHPYTGGGLKILKLRQAELDWTIVL